VDLRVQDHRRCTPDTFMSLFNTRLTRSPSLPLDDRAIA